MNQAEKERLAKVGRTFNAKKYIENEIAAIREQVASAIDIIVQQSRMPDGSRKITRIVEVTGREGDVIQMQDIFVFNQTGYGAHGEVEGYYSATGNIPYFIDELRQRGALTLDMNVFVPKT